MTFTSVHVARRDTGAAVSPAPTVSSCSPADWRPRFHLERLWSATLFDLGVEAFHDVAISFHVGATASLDVHLEAKQTQYLTSPGAGDHTADADGVAFDRSVLSWLGVTGVDVLAPGVGGGGRGCR